MSGQAISPSIFAIGTCHISLDNSANRKRIRGESLAMHGQELRDRELGQEKRGEETSWDGEGITSMRCG